MEDYLAKGAGELRAAIFDFDLTLADSTPAVVLCVDHALESPGLSPASPETIRRSMVGQKVPAVAALILVAACGVAPPSADACVGLDSVLAESSFVLLLAPQEGGSVSSPLRIRGCSRTFESNVVWELRGRDGRVLASGNATGGGVDGPAPFEVSGSFMVSEPEVGQLLVFEEDASDGEGFPPSRTVLPVVLRPS